MSEWEYRKIDLNQLPRKTDDIDLLCDAGEEGWELVAIMSNRIAYLKRQVADPPPLDAPPSVRRTRRKTEPNAK